MIRYLPIAVTSVCIVAVPILFGSYYVSLLSYVGIYTLVALGIVLLTGASGLISFGQAAFVGIGAYSTALLSTTFEMSPWLGLPVGLVLCAIVAFVLGLISLRLSGHYLALVTIAWGMTIFLLFGNSRSLGGHSGIIEIPPLSLFGFTLDTGIPYYFLIWIITGLAMFAASKVLGSRKGRAMRSLRGGNALVESLGVDAFRLRIEVFIIAALLASLAGWLYAHMQRYVGPAPFDLTEGITFLLMAIVGGIGSIWGALIGALVITSLSSVLQSILPLLTNRAANLEAIVYGCLFIILLQQARGGIAGWFPVRNSVQMPFSRRAATQSGARLAPTEMPKPGTVLLDVKGLTKRFGGLVAVHDVSFDIKAGEILGLIGPNGAGKSTTFDLISGIQKPTAGAITFRGIDLSKCNTREFIKRGMARTFQHVKLRRQMTALENVMVGTFSRTRSGFLKGVVGLDRDEEAAVAAEALAQIERVGLESRAYDLAGSLPLGQQRMLEVARAMATDPCLLMLDEPAAGLRKHEKKELAELLTRLRASGMTILLVEHDMEFVMGLVDRIVVLDFGKKLLEGSPETVRVNPIVQEAYLGGVV